MDLVVRNTVILQEIFLKLEVQTLKNARLVCRQWSIEACFAFTNRIRVHNAPSSSVTPFELEKFLVPQRLIYELSISLLEISESDADSNGELSAKDIRYTRQNNSKIYIGKLFGTLLNSNCALLITELSLVLMLRNAEDAKSLQNILVPAKSLREFELFCTCIGNEAIMSLPIDTMLEHKQLLTFAFKIEAYPNEKESLKLDSYIHLFKVFRRIQFLNLVSASKVSSFWPNLTKRNEGCILAIRDICMGESRDEFNLNSIHIDGVRSRVLELIPKKLKYISIEPQWTGMAELSQTLTYHSEALEAFEFYVSRYFEDDETWDGKCPVLPSLKFLGMGTNSWDSAASFHSRNVDIFKLREIFQDGIWTSFFPTLTVLVLSFPFVRNGETFNSIFYRLTEMRTLKILAISLLDDFDSTRIKNLRLKFPSLQILRHLVHDDDFNDAHVCEHRYQPNISNSIDKSIIVGIPLQFVKESIYSKNAKCVYERLKFALPSGPFNKISRKVCNDSSLY